MSNGRLLLLLQRLPTKRAPDGKHRYAVMQVPREHPQSAVAAEFLGLHMAIRLLPDVGAPEAVIAADCQAVVTAFKDLQRDDDTGQSMRGCYGKKTCVGLGV